MYNNIVVCLSLHEMYYLNIIYFVSNQNVPGLNGEASTGIQNRSNIVIVNIAHDNNNGL